MINATVVIATYNEAKNIGTLLDKLKDFETVIVVDDNSPDGTADIAAEYNNVHLIVRTKERGIASAYAEGFKKAVEYPNPYIIQMDAGLTHNPEDIIGMLAEMINKQAHLVIGARKFRLKSYRTLISLVAAFMMRLKGIKVTDATSGFRLWTKGTLLAVLKSCKFEQFRAKGFAFQLESLMLARKLGAKIIEFPVEYKLTNSSFKFKMLLEALEIYFGI